MNMHHNGIGLWPLNGVQCRKYAEEYKMLGKDGNISARRSAVFLGISRSWMALADQLAILRAIVEEEENKPLGSV
jgi:hypothetical protein